MKRALILLSGASASLYPLLSCALGLGDLQVDSRLNQPLRAHVEISDVTEEEWRQIHAHLNEQGDGGGLPRTTLDSIVFRTTEDASHRHFVELSSNDPITEPLFDLSIAVAGQTVQVVRNYSVFLDPPGRDEVGSRGVMVAGNGTQGAPGVAGGVAGIAGAAGRDTSGGVGAAGARAATQDLGSRVVAHDVTTRAARAVAGRRAAGDSSWAASARGGVSGAAGAGAAAGGGASRSVGAGGAVGAGAGSNQQVGLQAGGVYTVVQSDTLERIVRRLGARTAAAKGQQMRWVFEHNRAAFYGSVDRLRAGAQLTLPARVAAANDGSTATTAGNSASASATASAASAAASGSRADAPAATANTTNTAPVASAASGDRAVQVQLEGQVSSLQQALAKLRETIAAQDAQIVDLNRKIAAHAEQGRAERATSALAARIAPEVASASDERSGAAAASWNASAATSGDDTIVEHRPAKWWEKRATLYWAGGLGAAAIVLGLVAVTVSRRRREAEDLQYQPRYPLVEDSPFRYQATLESPPTAPVKPVVVRQPEPQMLKPGTSGLHVEEGPLQESGLESWSTQTALLLSDLPSADDTQPFMMAPHDDVEVTSASKRQSSSSAQEPTAKLQAMETHTVELQTTGELMSPEELAEAELLGVEAPAGPEDSRDSGKHWSLDDLDLGRDDEDETVIAPGDSRRAAANEAGPFGPGGGGGASRGGSDRGGPRDSRGAAGKQSQFDRDGDAGSSSGSGRGEPGQSRGAPGGASGRGEVRSIRGDHGLGGRNDGRRVIDSDEARTVELGSEELLAAQSLVAPAGQGPATMVMDQAQVRAAQLSAAELRLDRTAANKEVAEILEASLSYEPDRVDIKLKLLEIYHHQALGSRDNFRSLLSSLAKDSRLLSPVQRQQLETLQKSLDESSPDAASSSVAEVAI